MKIINPVPGETPDQRIVRCANNLVKAVLASGRTLHETSDVSGFDINIYRHRPGEINIRNILGDWSVGGKAPYKVTFRPAEPDNDLTEDTGEPEGEK